MLIELTAAAIVLVTIVFIFLLGAPPVSSTQAESQAVIDLLAPHAPAQIVDLGAGWGALVKRLARAFPAARVTGFELSPLPWLIAKLRCFRTPNAHIQWKDFRRADLTGVPAVVCYLARAPMQTVATLPKPGTLVVSVCFLFRDRTPIKTLRATGLGGEVALYKW